MARPCRSWELSASWSKKEKAELMRALCWQVLALARQQNKRVKVVGGGHSPSDIACTDGFMIHMGKMNRVLQVLRALCPLPLLAPTLGWAASGSIQDPRQKLFSLFPQACPPPCP